jgi:copper transport protein
VRWRRRALTVLAGFMLFSGAGVALAASASAHAVVEQSTPADGARLATAPAEVTITFDETVTLSSGYLRVVDSHGKRADTGPVTHPNGTGSTLRIALKTGLADDTYTVSYRVVSADSHPIGGSLRFVVGDGPLITSDTIDPGANSSIVVQAAAAAARWCTYLGVIALGGGWLLLWRWPEGLGEPRVVRMLWIGWIGLLIGAIAEVLVQGVVTAGSGLTSMFKPSLIDDTLHTVYGRLHSGRLIAIGVLGFELGSVLRSISRGRDTEEEGWRLEVAGISGVAVLATLAGSGHAAAANPRWLALASDMAHMAAVGCWIGGLAMLTICLLPLAPAEVADRAVRSFSPVALTCVGVLAVTGTYQAWRESGTWDALEHTAYGRLVIAKAAVLIALVAVAYFTRKLLLRPTVGTSNRLSRLNVPTVGTLRRRVAIEAGIGVVGLAVAAVLMAQAPGRAVALEQHAEKPVTTTVEVSANQTATLTVTPARHGPVAIKITITGGTSPQSISATATLKAKDLGPLDLGIAGQGREWAASSALLPSAGNWSFAITVRTSQFDSTTATAIVRIY